MKEPKISLHCLRCQEKGKLSIVCNIEGDGWLVEYRKGDVLSVREQVFDCPECKQLFRLESEPDSILGIA